MVGNDQTAGTRLRSRSVRGSTLEQLNITRQDFQVLHQGSGPSLGEGWDVVVRKIDHLDSSLHKALHRLQKHQQEAFDQKLEDLSRMIEDVFESLKHGSESPEPLSLEKSPANRKPPEISPRFAELPRCPFGKSQGSERLDESTDPSSPESCTTKKQKTLQIQESPESPESPPSQRSKDLELMSHVLSASVGKKIYKRNFLKRVIWTCLEDSNSSYTAWWYGLSVNCLIVLSVLLSVYLVSFPGSGGYIAWVLDFSVDIVFAADLLVRLLSWPTLANFFLNIYNIIDMSVLPSLFIRAAIPLLTPNDGVWSTILLCFFPVVRLLKLLRRVQTFQVLLSAWWAVFEALPMLIYVLTIIAMTFASLLFVFEPESNIPDWPTALWLTVVSMTGLGYGDLTPQTSEGKVFVSVLIVTSLLYLSIPFGILGSAFTLAWAQRSAVLAIRKLRKHLANHGFNSADVPKLLEHFDLNHDSEISLVEFRTMINDMMIGLSDREVIDLFECLDLRKEGRIGPPVFLAILFPRSYEENGFTDFTGVSHLISLPRTWSPASMTPKERLVV